MMKTAKWKNTIIAQSEDTVLIENNHYFPPESVNFDLLEKSDFHSTCPWKGEASYYHLVSNGERLDDAAWYYPEVTELARAIKGYVAFWKGVIIE